MFNFFDNYNFSQLVTTPTKDGNILDLILTNRPDIYKEVTVESPIANSDHCMVSASLMILSNEQDNDTVQCRVQRHFDPEYASSILQHVNWDVLFWNSFSVDEFVAALMQVIDNAVPYVVVNKSIPGVS
jgi:hypothetical protein